MSEHTAPVPKPSSERQTKEQSAHLYKPMDCIEMEKTFNTNAVTFPSPTATLSAQVENDSVIRNVQAEGSTAEDLAFEVELQKSLGMEAGQADPFALTLESVKEGDSIGEAELGEQSKSRRPSKADSDEGDNDSLFGGGSEDVAGADDGIGDTDEDADADGELDAEGEDDDDDGNDDGEDEDEDDVQPLSRSIKTTSGQNAIAGVKFSGRAGGSGSSRASTVTASTTPLPLPQSGAATSNQTASDKPLANATAPESGLSRLSRPAVPGLTTIDGFDADYTQFSNDVFLSTTLGGQAIIWDRRVPSSAELRKGVRALPLPEKTPPWCASAIWAPDGERIYIGRRNEGVEEWDMRMLSENEASGDLYSSLSYSWAPPRRRVNPGLRRTLRFPSSSGPVTSLACMPNGRHLVCASYDNVRLWNLSLDTTSSSSATLTGATSTTSSAIPFRIVAGHHGGMISSLALDVTGRFLFSASGDRGWISGSTETILISEVTSVP